MRTNLHPGSTYDSRTATAANIGFRVQLSSLLMSIRRNTSSLSSYSHWDVCCACDVETETLAAACAELAVAASAESSGLKDVAVRAAEESLVELVAGAEVLRQARLRDVDEMVMRSVGELAVLEPRVINRLDRFLFFVAEMSHSFAEQTVTPHILHDVDEAHLPGAADSEVCDYAPGAVATASDGVIVDLFAEIFIVDTTVFRGEGVEIPDASCQV
ncbi:hypothetical protein HG530_014432 [Fusarium avenaceum]|nr:hypothetical protein HG530_014432 [Fusarium avenaceum]